MLTKECMKKYWRKLKRFITTCRIFLVIRQVVLSQFPEGQCRNGSNILLAYTFVHSYGSGMLYVKQDHLYVWWWFQQTDRMLPLEEVFLGYGVSKFGDGPGLSHPHTPSESWQKTASKRKEHCLFLPYGTCYNASEKNIAWRQGNSPVVWKLLRTCLRPE